MVIPVCEPTIGELEKKYVNDCLDTNWISSNGKYIEQFEKEFANFCDAKYGVSCSNGTAALHLALKSVGIGDGDEVIVPDFSMIATANAVIYCGAKPIFIDANMDTWNMEITDIEENITDKTKAIMVVHTYGNPVDMDKINDIAHRHNLYVIEDAAEAHGAIYKDQMIGSLSDVAAFSFYGNKILTTGEGGMVVTNTKRIADRAKYLRNHAFCKDRFTHYDLGFNYRMTNIQAAIGLAQTEKATILRENRINNARLYNNLLKNVKGVTLPPESKFGSNVYWMYGILLPNHTTKLRVMEELEREGIQTRSFFRPMSIQPIYEKMGLTTCSGNVHAINLYLRGLYLPSASHLTEEEIEYVCKTLKKVLK